MKRKRQKPEEIVKELLREAATLPAGASDVDGVCKKLGVSSPTYFRW